MTAAELRASLSLASVFALRLFGMFVILPVFALWADGRPGWSLTLVGMALGAYGLTQALLQFPFGWLSDRRGRKPVIYLGLVMLAAGSFVCALAETPAMVILGRILQGAGAISATVMAMAADLTRESQRTKSMAIIGSTIGAVFAISFVAGPVLMHAVGVPGIFATTGVLALVAIAVVRFIVPAQPTSAPSVSRIPTMSLLRSPELARLNVGIFALHAVLMALFIVVPVALARSGLAASSHGWVYLGTVFAGFVLVLPVIARRGTQRERPVFLGAIAAVALGVAILALRLDSFWMICAGLVIFFAGFNVLEAKLPALVSRAAPREARGAATGVYSSVQFLGTFFGAASGGAVAQHAGFVTVLVCCLAVTAGWFAVAWNMGEFLPAAAPASRT
ncbi:MAG: MFS transporter [Usitatibacter sp.]